MISLQTKFMSNYLILIESLKVRKIVVLLFFLTGLVISVSEITEFYRSKRGLVFKFKNYRMQKNIAISVTT